MTKRYLGLVAIPMIVLFLISSASGQSKPRKARTSSTSTKQPNSAAKVGLNETSTTKPNTEAPFLGGSDDGSSMRRKPPRKGRTALEGDPDQPIVVGSVTSKKPDHFTGGSDDGQSIRRTQPRNNQANGPQINANPVATPATVNANKPGNNQSRKAAMNKQEMTLGIKSPEKSVAQVGPGGAGAKQKQPRKPRGH